MKHLVAFVMTVAGLAYPPDGCACDYWIAQVRGASYGPVRAVALVDYSTRPVQEIEEVEVRRVRRVVEQPAYPIYTPQPVIVQKQQSVILKQSAPPPVKVEVRNGLFGRRSTVLIGR